MIKNVLQFLDASAEKYPDKVCFEDISDKMTFAELKEYSVQIGSGIIKRVGEAKHGGKPIAIMMKKGIGIIKTMMGVVASGNFYAPLDITMPEHRLSLILHSLKPELIIVDDECLKLHCKFLSERYENKLIELNKLITTDICRSELYHVRERHIDTNPLYIVYTSGSTGNPKGVLTPHRAVINIIKSFTKAMELTNEDVNGY